MFRIGGDSQDHKLVNLTKELIGGKALSLVEMVNLGLNVPPAAVIPCAETFEFYKDGPATLEKWRPAVEKALSWIEQQVGRKCLFSVRSGAPISCPGMMDTVLNVGLCKDNFGEFAKLLGPKAVADSQARLIEMYGTTVMGKEKSQIGLGEKMVIMGLSPVDQVMSCVGAVFKSWMSDRAIEYRKLNNIPEDLGTAVTIQAMVYGNLNDNSGSGVLFTRDPSTGEKKIMAEYLNNAQGEDVVAGTHTPVKLKLSGEHLSEGTWQWDLEGVCLKLEKHYRDMVDVEFTVEDGKLYVLQSRRGKRTHKAAVRIATDLLSEGLVDSLQGILTKEQLFGCLGTQITLTGKAKLIGKGLPAGGGVARGRAIFNVDMAVKVAKKEPVILVREETLPDDIAGMAAAVGIVTAKGGATSHAAVVSRAMNKSCVVGIGHYDHQIQPDVMLVVNGDTGEVWVDDGSMKFAEGGDKEVMDLAALLAKKAGKALVSERPIEGVPTVVYAADMFLGSDFTMLNYGAFSTHAEKDPSNVIVNLMLPHELVDPADHDIWDLLSTGVAQEWTDVVKGINGQFQHKDLTKVVLIDPHKFVKDADKVSTQVKMAETVADAFSGKPVMLPTDFVSRIVGGDDMMEKLKSVLGTPKVLADPAHPYELILKAIA